MLREFLWSRCEFEAFSLAGGAPTRSRQKKIVARIGPGRRRTIANRRNDVNQPLSFYRSAVGRQVQNTNNYDPREEDVQRGHLIALGMGGPNEPANLAPMYAGINRSNGAWGRMEGELEKLINRRGLTVILEIQFYYGTDDPRIPIRFNVKATAENFQTMNWNIPNIRPYRAEGGADPVQKQEYENAKQRMAKYARDKLNEPNGNWYIEDFFARKIGQNAKHSEHRDEDFWFPPMPRHDTIKDINFIRPYAFLDFIDLEGAEIQQIRLAYHRIIGSIGRSVDSGTRTTVLAANRVLNDGWLVSDAAQQERHLGTQGPFDPLTYGGQHSSAEVDHIVPRSRSGPLCFSNVQVLGGRENSTASNAIKSGMDTKDTQPYKKVTKSRTAKRSAETSLSNPNKQARRE